MSNGDNRDKSSLKNSALNRHHASQGPVGAFAHPTLARTGHTAKLILCWPLRQYLDFCRLGFDASHGNLPAVFDIVFKETRLTSQHRLR